MLLLTVLGAVNAHATTYFVSPSGTDNPAGGTSLATAWRTFAFAIPRLNPGDELLVDRGTWTNATGVMLDIRWPWACSPGSSASGAAS